MTTFIQRFPPVLYAVVEIRSPGHCSISLLLKGAMNYNDMINQYGTLVLYFIRSMYARYYRIKHKEKSLKP